MRPPDYSDKEMHAALEVNIPNYASAVVTTDEVVAAISSSAGYKSLRGRAPGGENAIHSRGLFFSIAGPVRGLDAIPPCLKGLFSEFAKPGAFITSKQ
jgi:hypothetical protein